MKAYKKRAKGSWNVGKSNKGDGSERQYARTEITQMMREDYEEYRDKYRKASRKKNTKARLEHQILWLEQRIAFWSKHVSWYASSLRSDLEKTKKKLKEFTEKKGQTS